jgi:hypothetical protein
MSGKLLFIVLLISLMVNSCTKVEPKGKVKESQPISENTEEIEELKVEQPKKVEPAKEVVKFDLKKLSEAGKDAYHNLLNAQSFQSPHLGDAGTFSSLVESLGILLEEKNADEAFKALLQNATLPGQLYALCGLYFTDYAFFQKEVKRFTENDESIETINGCIISPEKVSQIVELKDPKVAIIKPSETLEDFWKTHSDGARFDIAHGGYPANFKESFEKEKKKKR